MFPTASAPGLPTANFIDYSITDHLHFRMMEENALKRLRSAMLVPAPPCPTSCLSTAAAKGT